MLVELLGDRIRLTPSRPVDRQTLYETLHALPDAPSTACWRAFQARPSGTVVRVGTALEIMARWLGVSTAGEHR